MLAYILGAHHADACPFGYKAMIKVESDHCKASFVLLCFEKCLHCRDVLLSP